MSPRRILPLGVTLVVWALVGACSRPPAEPAARAAGTDNSRVVLQRAADALKAVREVEYDFEYGHADDPTGWVTGSTRMRRVNDPLDSWIRVTGTVQAQPRFKVARQSFDFGIDDIVARVVNHTDRSYEETPPGRGSNRLAWNAIYGYITEFIEAEPLWKELRMSKSIALLSPETIDDVACDVVQTIFDTGQGGAVDVRWSFASTDHLPRRGRWISASSGPNGVVFTLTRLRVSPEPTQAAFPPASPVGYRRVVAPPSPGLGESAPEWELSQPSGEVVRSRDLSGRIVVLDFWNTWCYQCRALTPQTRALERAFAGQEVTFFGVNILESGDPVAYWKEGGFPYPLLLGRDDVARRFDITIQPAVVVVGADGRILYSQLGATHDRADRVRAAIRAGLVALGRG